MLISGERQAENGCFEGECMEITDALVRQLEQLAALRLTPEAEVRQILRA